MTAPKILHADACVIGAGAGGIGCVYHLLKGGASVVVVDKNPDFGGTAVFSGVDGWEPGVSLDGIHTLLYEEMRSMEGGCHVVESVPNCKLLDPEHGDDWRYHSFEAYPWGLAMASDLPYEATLGRCTSIRGDGSMKRLQFEPTAYCHAVHRVLMAYEDRLVSLFSHTYKGCTVENGRLTSVTVTGKEGDVKIYASYFVDATGDILLARDAGCAFTIGSEGREVYDEPSAGEGSDRINAVTYVFRIAKSEKSDNIDVIPPEYADVELGEWQKEAMPRTVSCFVEYPSGDINVNMLPTMQGNEYLALGESADRIGRARVWAYWHYLQTKKGMKGYTLVRIYDAGIRESYRLIGRYVLKEQDLRLGMLRRPKLERTIAIADHALDIHGDSGMCKELVYPYEIPLSCAQTREYDNLLVACRGASFSHIAASSVRLTRTMLSFGEGVGAYIAEKIAEQT